MKDTRFEWQTDEEEDLLLPPSAAQAPLRRRRRWLLLGMLLLLVIMALLASSYFLRRQRQLADGLHEDVLATFNLWHRAVEQQDSELFTNLLAADNQGWRQVQQRLLAKDLIVGRPFLSLSPVKDRADAAQVTLSPDWQEAVVTFERTYGLDETGEPVKLEHTLLFERRASSWLQKAPGQDFWGDWQRLATDMLIVEYPARDAEVAQRIGRRLDDDLRAICTAQDAAGIAPPNQCALLQPFVFTLSSSAESLVMLEQTGGSLLPGASFAMPAPSLTGLPVDEASFAPYYDGYTRRLREHVRTLVSSPIPMPDQVIRTLCFNYPTLGPRLFKFEPAAGTWEQELPKRSFRALHTLGDGQGLILDEILGNYRSPQTHFIQLQEGAERILLDEISRDTPYRIASPVNNSGPNLLLQAQTADGSGLMFRRLDLDACGQIECETTSLPGYTVWSPDGRWALISQRNGIYLAGDDGQNPRYIGEGTNALWLDDERVAYIQFRRQDSHTITALVTTSLSSGDEQTVLDSDDLAQTAGIESGMLFMRTVVRHPNDHQLLLVHARGVGDYAGHYFIFSARLPAEAGGQAVDIRLHLQREGALGGDDGHFGPNGPLPFLPSPDGRWLLVSESIGYNSPSRTFLLVDLQGNQTKIVSTGEPVFPAQFPSYDWSADGRWLVIAGNNFFRLLAPAYDYEQLLPHEFDYCAFTRWSD